MQPKEAGKSYMIGLGANLGLGMDERVSALKRWVEACVERGEAYLDTQAPDPGLEWSRVVYRFNTQSGTDFLEIDSRRDPTANDVGHEIRFGEVVDQKLHEAGFVATSLVMGRIQVRRFV